MVGDLLIQSNSKSMFNHFQPHINSNDLIRGSGPFDRFRMQLLLQRGLPLSLQAGLFMMINEAS